MARKRERAKQNGGGLWETIKTIIYAVLIALVIRTFLYEPFSIPSGSMFPTLFVGDYVFVSKFSYGYSRHSFPWAAVPFDGRILEGAPDRGDIVVFKVPQDGWRDYIKRVVGVPGDRIQVVDGILHINDCPVRREEIGTWSFEASRRANGPTSAPSLRPRFMYRETFPTNGPQHRPGEPCDYADGHQHRILEARDNAVLDNTDVFVVPANHFFMMGDNRDNSSDSRASVGYVPAENLVGRADIIFYSTDYSARIWEIWRWWSATRFDRILRSLE